MPAKSAYVMCDSFQFKTMNAGYKVAKNNVFKMFLEWQLRSRHLVKLKHVIRTRAGPKFSELNENVWFVLGANFQFRSFLERVSHGIYSTQLLTPFSTPHLMTFHMIWSILLWAKWSLNKMDHTKKAVPENGARCRLHFCPNITFYYKNKEIDQKYRLEFSHSNVPWRE